LKNITFKKLRHQTLSIEQPSYYLLLDINNELFKFSYEIISLAMMSVK